MSTGRLVCVALALSLLVFICAAAVSSSKPAEFVPAVCPGCEPVPYTPSEAKP